MGATGWSHVPGIERYGGAVIIRTVEIGRSC